MQLAFAIGQRGWARVERENVERGIAEIEESLVTLRAAGAEIGRPRFLSFIAEAWIKVSRFEDAHAALIDAQAAADENEDRTFEAEIYRLKSELLLKQNPSSMEEAQRFCERAIEIARKQSAKSLELRATTSLARLLANQGRREQGRAMLAGIYDWFTEGFDTADLIDAKALLDELNS